MTRPYNFWRRQNFIVDETFQYALIRLLVAVWIFNTAVLGWFMYYLYAGPVFDFAHLSEPDIQILPGSPPQFSNLLILAAALGLGLVVAVGLHLSHQIAGPIYRLKQSMIRVSAGELDFTIRFRKGDYLNDIPDIFNEMLASLKNRTARDVEVLKAIEATLPDDAEARNRLKSLREDKESELTAFSSEDDASDDATLAGREESLASAES